VKILEGKFSEEHKMTYSEGCEKETMEVITILNNHIFRTLFTRKIKIELHCRKYIFDSLQPII
jgi:hypothetical protein